MTLTPPPNVCVGPWEFNNAEPGVMSALMEHESFRYIFDETFFNSPPQDADRKPLVQMLLLIT